MTPSNRLDLMHDQVYVRITVLLHVVTVKFLIVYSLPWYISYIERLCTHTAGV